VTLGEGRAGKTSITLKFARNEFHENEQSTINANFLQKKLSVSNTQIQLNIWDTAGQERFRALAPNYYRQATGVVIVYDITDRSSFDRVVNWVKELQMQADKDIAIVIAGNKCDRESERQINKNEAEEFANKIGAAHFLTSAKTGKGVNECFEELGKRVVSRQAPKQQATTHSRGRKINLGNHTQAQTNKKKSCC